MTKTTLCEVPVGIDRVGRMHDSGAARPREMAERSDAYPAMLAPTRNLEAAFFFSLMRPWTAT